MRAATKRLMPIGGVKNPISHVSTVKIPKTTGSIPSFTAKGKNTAVKINHQGSGYSHQIKDFFELRARELKLRVIFHFCRIDDFRMYSLNESHGYKKTSRRLGKNGEVVEWRKTID